MKKYYSILMVAIIASTLTVCAAEQFQINDPHKGSKMQGNTTAIKKFNLALSKYPMHISSPISNKLILQDGLVTSEMLGISKIERLTDESTDGDVKIRRMKVELENGHHGYVSLSLASNAVTELQYTLETAYTKHGISSRQNTWWGAKCVEVTLADFISNYDGDSGILLICSYQNLGFKVDYKYGEEKYMTKGEEVSIYNNISSALFPSINHTKLKSDGIQLSYSPVDVRSGHISWNADSFNKHWIRMDVDKGRLTILEKGKVLVEGVPDGGTKVYCIAISPEGKQEALAYIDIM